MDANCMLYKNGIYVWDAFENGNSAKTECSTTAGGAMGLPCRQWTDFSLSVEKGELAHCAAPVNSWMVSWSSSHSFARCTNEWFTILLHPGYIQGMIPESKAMLPRTSRTENQIRIGRWRCPSRKGRNSGHQWCTNDLPMDQNTPRDALRDGQSATFDSLRNLFLLTVLTVRLCCIT